MHESRKHILFICSRNRLRSPTAEKIFSKSMHLDVRSRGLAASATRRVATADIVWAESIFVMESEHKKQLLRSFRKEAEFRRICVLDIPDDYDFMDPELVTLIKAGVRGALGEEGTP
jgi:predicted protein tyrosine phosphatase